MNENIDLVEILKNVPEGTPLWSPIFGDVEFERIDTEDDYYPIVCSTTDDEETFTKEGYIYEAFENAECVLFPSREQRDWSKFNTKNRIESIELKPFYRVLVRDLDDEEWHPKLFARKRKDSEYPYEVLLTGSQYRQVIPYNDNTAKLAFTNKTPDRKYIITDASESQD